MDQKMLYLTRTSSLKGCCLSKSLDDAEKVGFLWSMSGAKERLKVFKADLMVEGSFEDAVDGVDGVFHTASPVLVPYDSNIQASNMTHFNERPMALFGSSVCIHQFTYNRLTQNKTTVTDR